jgi:peptidoglycan-associated lipoprotein
MNRYLILGVATLGLAACDPAIQHGEAGRVLEDGAFGAASRNNLGLQTGQITFSQALNERFVSEVPTTVNFAFDSARLDAEARRVLDRQADWIRQFPEVRFRVYGHTDLVGSAGYNQRLGQRRAEAVVAYLASRGISRSRLEAVVSFGQTRPVIDTPDPERLNRRAVTNVSGFVQRHPTVLDGQYAQIVQREYVESATRPLPPISRTDQGVTGN